MVGVPAVCVKVGSRHRYAAGTGEERQRRGPRRPRPISGRVRRPGPDAPRSASQHGCDPTPTWLRRPGKRRLAGDLPRPPHRPHPRSPTSMKHGRSHAATPAATWTPVPGARSAGAHRRAFRARRLAACAAGLLLVYRTVLPTSFGFSSRYTLLPRCQSFALGPRRPDCRANLVARPFPLRTISLADPASGSSLTTLCRWFGITWNAYASRPGLAAKKERQARITHAPRSDGRNTPSSVTLPSVGRRFRVLMVMKNQPSIWSSYGCVRAFLGDIGA